MKDVGIPTKTLWEIKKEVCQTFGISAEDLEGRSRLKSMVMARKVFSFRCRQEAFSSLEEIGVALGGRDHTSIMHYLRTFPASALFKQ